MTTMTHTPQSTASPGLLLAFEIAERRWKLGFTTGLGQRLRVRDIQAGAVAQLREEIERARVRLDVAPDVAVISCYQAGRIGFCLHRYLVSHGVTNYVIDSASIEVNRRAKRQKTDGLDLVGLLNLLARYQLGDRRAWRVVRVPSVEAEDARQSHRMRETLQQDRTRVINRIKGLLANHGVSVPLLRDFPTRLEGARLWDGRPLPPGLKQRVTVAWQQGQFLNEALAAHDVGRDGAYVDPDSPTGRWVERLQTLRAIGANGAWVLATEMFGWREIRNRGELAALIGVSPTLFQSGDTEHDSGITRAGNSHVRRMIVQLAWAWLRYQPESALAQWYQRRFGGGGARIRRIGIVALARKLVIALWRYGEYGVIPEGAVLKSRITSR